MPDGRRKTPMRRLGDQRPGTAVSDEHAATLLASLRAAEVYVRVVIDRFELAIREDRARGDGSTNLLGELVEASELLQRHADRLLRALDPNMARQARAIASMARERRTESLPERTP